MTDACMLGSVSFASYPSGAIISMDGVVQGVKTPAIVTNVPVGSHPYILKLAGYNDYQGSITVLESQTVTATSNMIPESYRGLYIGLMFMGLSTLGIIITSNNNSYKKS